MAALSCSSAPSALIGSWWALRPSLRHPTLELRITDCCTAVEDAVAIAALHRALVRHVVRRPNVNAGFGAIARALIEENRWRAQRYGTNGSYVDLATRRTVSFDPLLAETLHSVQDDAAELGVEDDIKHVLSIKQRGTSAQRQLKLYDECGKSGRPPRRAMREVASWLRAATECGNFIAPESQRRRGGHGTPNTASDAATPEQIERLLARG
jgi:carboxylate-amine ligase